MAALGAAAVSSGHRLVCFEEVDSTNAEALRRAAGGESGPVWFTAARQTAGRGRRGRGWASPAGNLHATLLLTDVPPPRTPLLGLLMAVALADAIESVAPEAGAALRLKWPNDILVHGAKLAGILVEAESSGARHAAAVGCGVNCAAAPDGMPHPVASLAALGFAAGPDAVLAALSDAVARRLLEWHDGGGIAALRSAWLARAAGLGRPITVRLPDRTLEGVFETLDGEGRLILRQPGGLHTISFGEVFFGRLPQFTG